MTRAIYDAIGFTPYRALFIHLILVGYPLRFGLYPTGWGKEWLHIPESIIPAPCHIFHPEKRCTRLEELVVQDFGVRFISSYSLAWVVFFTMRTTISTTVAFHRILFALSWSQLIVISWLQAFFHPTPSEREFSSEFFGNMVLYTMAATAISLWSIATHPYIPVESMKWSIPANAIFCGAVRME